MVKTLCCCCFSNNVRHLILLLSVACSTILFANLLLFNVTVLYNTGYQLSSLNSVSYSSTPSNSRLKRELNEERNTSESLDVERAVAPPVGDLLDINDTVTQQIIAAVVEKREQDGHPVAPSDESELRTTTRPTATTSKPETRFFTRSPLETAERVSTSASTATTTTVPTAALPTPTKASEQGETYKKSPVGTDKNYFPAESSKWADFGKPTDSAREPDDVHVTEIEEDQLARKMRVLALFVSPGVGLFCGALPAAWILRLVGSRKLFTGALVLSAFATLSLAFVLPNELNAYIAAGLRCVQGIALSCVFPMLGSLTANWGSLKEQFFFLAFGSTFIQLAPLMSWPVSALMVLHDYKLTYIMHSVVTLFMAVIWLMFYRDRPQYHPWVNGLELNKIVTGKIKAISNRNVEDQSCGTFLRSPSVWAILVAAFGFFLIVSLVSQFLPLYCRFVVVEGRADSIFLASSPFMFMFLVMLFHSLWYRAARLCINDKSILICNTVSFVLCGVILIFLAVFPPGSQYNYSVVLSFSVLLSCLVFSIYGFVRSVTLVARYYGQFIVSHMQFAMGNAFLCGSLLVVFFVRNNTIDEWRLIFVLIAAVVLISGAVFAVFGSASVEDWAKESWDPAAARRMISVDQIDYHNDECGILEMRVLQR